MKKILMKISYCLAIAAFLGATAAAHAGLAIIAHPSNPIAGITADEAAKIYLGKSTSFANGRRVVPVDQREGTRSHKKFYKTVVKKDDRALKSYWSKLIFTGKGKPPEVVGDDQAVKKWVAEHPNGLGYVDAKVLDRSVKVLLVVP